MERRSFLKKAGVGLAAGAVAAPALAQTAPTIKWRMASSFPKSLDTLHGSAEFLVKRIAEMSGGKFQIQLFAAGEIVPGPGVHDAVKDGTVEIGFTCSYYYFGKEPTYCIDTAIPFGMNARQVKAWYRQGNGQKLMNEFFAKSNIVSFPSGNTGVQMGGWYRKEINGLDDLKGLKMRTMENPIHIQAYKAFGIIPTPMAFPEVYAALEQKAIDAQENPLNVILANKFYEVQKHLALTNHQYNPQSLIISKKVWDGLAEGDRKVLQDAANEASKFQRKTSRDASATTLDALKKAGMQVTELSAAEQEELRTKLKPVIDKHGAAIPATVAELQAELARIRAAK